MAVGGIVTGIIGGAVGLLVLGAMLPLLFDGSAQAADALNDPNVTTGSEEADSLKSVYSIIIGFGAVLLVGSIAFALVKFKSGGF